MPSRLEGIRKVTATDTELQLVSKLVRSGWPEHMSSVPLDAREYLKVRSELSVENGLLLRGCRIVVPWSMRGEILEKLHHGPQGLIRCRERAKASVWWPGLSKQLKNTVTSCQVCRELKRVQQKEPLISTPLPDRPWQRIALDLCEHNHNYLIISDYYSRFLEILHLSSTTSAHIIQKLRTVFARFGVVDQAVSDNGPQFASTEFQNFAKELDFEHISSSPHHPQGNGHAERAVQTAKKILKQKDPLLALMIYRSTPCSTTGFSPAELLMGRRIRTTVPTLEKNLLPKWPSRKAVRVNDAKQKTVQAHYFNRRHGARPLPALQPGEIVYTRLDHEKTWSRPAVVSGEATTQRSYTITTQDGAVLRRSRRHLLASPASHHTPPSSTESAEMAVQPAATTLAEAVPANQAVSTSSAPLPSQTVTRSGRVCEPVNRLDL